MVKLDIYASVEEHNMWVRKAILAELATYGITAEQKADKIEFHYIGDKPTVARLVSLCESNQAHSIHVTVAGS